MDPAFTPTPAAEDPADRLESMVGKQVGSYRIVRQIGEGGMGVVYEATHESIGKRAAIKFLHKKLSGDAKAVQRFFNEARAVGSLDHQGLVSIIDQQQLEDGTAYIIMEFLAGESLEARLEGLREKKAAMQGEQAMRVVRQVASALAVAHEHGIVHCDLKPENIFLIPDALVAGGDRVKVLDFGIAKFLAGDGGGKTTTIGLVLGTPRYMSPEQCEGREKVDSKVDVYALGVIFFEMLAGKPPFEAESATALMRQHMVKEPPPLLQLVPTLARKTAELAGDMLRKEAASRPSMTEVLERLDGVAAALGPAPRKRPLLIYAAVGAALLLLLTAGIMRKRHRAARIRPPAQEQRIEVRAPAPTPAKPPTEPVEDRASNAPLGGEASTRPVPSASEGSRPNQPAPPVEGGRERPPLIEKVERPALNDRRKVRKQGKAKPEAPAPTDEIFKRPSLKAVDLSKGK